MSMQAREDDRQEFEDKLGSDNTKMRKALHKLLSLEWYKDGHYHGCSAGKSDNCACSCGYTLIVEGLG